MTSSESPARISSTSAAASSSAPASPARTRAAASRSRTTALRSPSPPWPAIVSSSSPESSRVSRSSAECGASAIIGARQLGNRGARRVQAGSDTL